MRKLNPISRYRVTGHPKQRGKGGPPDARTGSHFESGGLRSVSGFRSRGFLPGAVARKDEILEEEGRQLGAARETGLPVDGHGVLPSRPFASVRDLCDSLVTVALQQEQGHLALGRGQPPCVELPVDRLGEPFKGSLSVLSPRVPLSLSGRQRSFQVGYGPLGPPPPEPQPGDRDECRQDQQEFEDWVEGQPPVRGVQDEVHRAPDRDGEEHHDEEEPEAGSGRVVHFPLVLAVLLPLFSLGALIAIRRGATTRKAWALPLFLAGALAGSTWLAVETGEAEEDRVEAVVAEEVIHHHEEAGERFLVLSGILLLVAGVGLASGKIGAVARVVATVAAAGLVLVAVQVGASGGDLVYEHGAASAYVASHDTVPLKAGRE
jgi:hypothetical protein